MSEKRTPDLVETVELHWRWGCYNAADGYPQPEPRGYWDYPQPEVSYPAK